MLITIHVREYGGTYIARSEGRTASCTSAAHYAAERVALKVKLGKKDVCEETAEKNGILLNCVGKGLYTAFWEDPND